MPQNTLKRSLIFLGMVLLPAVCLGQTNTPPLNPALRITQYVHQVWDTYQGLPQNTIYTVAQTPDGYLWIGTGGGLARFDGVSFTTYDRSHVDWLPGNEIRALLTDRKGTLWIASSSGGLLRRIGGQVIALAPGDGFPDDQVNAFFEDTGGNVWIATGKNGVIRYDGVSFTVYNRENGLISPTVLSIAETTDGSMWFGTPDGLSRFRNGHFLNETQPDVLKGLAVRALAADRNQLWIGTDTGLFVYRDGTFESPRLSGCRESISTLMVDRAGSLWIGTRNEGVCRLAGKRLESFTTEQGLSDEQVTTFFQDREGSLWVGTEGGGLNRMNCGAFAPLSSIEGLSGDAVHSVLEDRSGTLWVGTDGHGLNLVSRGMITTLGTTSGLTSTHIYALHEDDRRQLWIGTFGGGICRRQESGFACRGRDDGLPSNNVWTITDDNRGALWLGTEEGLVRMEGDSLQVFTTRDGLSSNWVTSLVADRHGNLWVGTSGAGLNFRRKDGRFRTYTRRHGLTSDIVLSLYEGSDGILWVGTREGGLCRLNRSLFTCVTTRDGLHDDNILQILEDDRGFLWLGSLKGIARVKKSDVLAYVQHESGPLPIRIFGKEDGVKSTALVGGSQPVAWKTRDGHLWFSTLKGVVVVVPDIADRKIPEPSVVIELVRTDGQTTAASGPLRFRPGSKDLEIDYTAPSFIAPQRLRFRYRLEGYDAGWIDAGSRRSAFYTNLAPGSYTFLVQVREDGAGWGKQAAFRFTIEPFFYQTDWFYALVVFLLVVAAFGLYSARVRLLRRREQTLRRRVEEQTAELRAREVELKTQYEQQIRLTGQVRNLASALTLAEQKERRRISQILHDDLQQLLYGIRIKFHFLMEDLPGDSPGYDQLRRSHDLIGQAIETTRRLSVDLSPVVLDGEGLLEALQWLRSHMAEVYGLIVDIRTEGTVHPFSEDMRVLLFQLVRELLFNVARHARTNRATVELAQTDSVFTIRVSDEGTGFEPLEPPGEINLHGGSGLFSVRERLGLFNGKLDIRSRPGSGTCVTITLPIFQDPIPANRQEVHLLNHSNQE